MTSHNETVDEFADLLKHARETLGITQNGMAARIGEALNDPDFDFMQISRWERGANRPDTTRLPAIITAYQLHPIQEADPLNPTQAMAAFIGCGQSRTQ